jgi:hypothetical protein
MPAKYNQVSLPERLDPAFEFIAASWNVGKLVPKAWTVAKIIERLVEQELENLRAEAEAE